MSSVPPVDLRLVYDGYDPSWILGRDKGPAVVPKPKPPPPPAAAPKPMPAPKDPDPEPVVLKVHFCCEGCVERMTTVFKDLEGLERVIVDPASSTVTITGKVSVEECLKLARKIASAVSLAP